MLALIKCACLTLLDIAELLSKLVILVCIFTSSVQELFLFLSTLVIVKLNHFYLSNRYEMVFTDLNFSITVSLNIFLCQLPILAFGLIFVKKLFIYLIYLSLKNTYYGKISTVFKSRKNCIMNCYVLITQHCQFCFSTSFPPLCDFIVSHISFHMEIFKHNHNTILAPCLKRKTAFS